jgi:hypothetical protein
MGAESAASALKVDVRLGTTRTKSLCRSMSAYGRIVLQNSPRGGWQAISRTNRIGTNKFLHQGCAQAPDLESMLLARTLKIVLQHYLPQADIRALPFQGGSRRIKPRQLLHVNRTTNREQGDRYHHVKAPGHLE